MTTLIEFLAARLDETIEAAFQNPDTEESKKTRVLAIAVKSIAEEHGDQHECADWENDGAAPYVGCNLLRCLAAVYSDHENYQEEWAPE